MMPRRTQENSVKGIVQHMNQKTKMEKDLKSLSRKYEDAIQNYYDLLSKLNPLNVTSKFISCRECGSKLNTDRMRSHVISTCRLSCPVCGSDTALYSATSNSRLVAAMERRTKAKEKYSELQSKMNLLIENESSRRTQADGLEEVRNHLEIIYNETKTPDFIEVKGEIGGDLLCYRVYKDGYVCEKQQKCGEEGIVVSIIDNVWVLLLQCDGNVEKTSIHDIWKKDTDVDGKAELDAFFKKIFGYSCVYDE